MNSITIASTIDHTILKPDCTIEQVRTLVREAITYRFASVCILPWHVADVRMFLGPDPLPICTVIGFPLGASTTSSKVHETIDAIANGAREIDMVASITALKSGQRDRVARDIRDVTSAAHDHGARVKVIIETCLLSDDEKLMMCELVTNAGADFIKTSTGFSTGGATIDDVRLLRQNVGPNVAVKASGGIRDVATAIAMIEAGAARLGTSSGVAIVTSAAESSTPAGIC
jgi:deoxyribose-phosphate aldolase